MIAEILTAAANPHAERIDVIIKALPKDRRVIIEKSAREMRQTTKGIIARGRAALEAMTDEEWDRLIHS